MNNNHDIVKQSSHVIPVAAETVAVHQDVLLQLLLVALPHVLVHESGPEHVQHPSLSFSIRLNYKNKQDSQVRITNLR